MLTPLIQCFCGPAEAQDSREGGAGQKAAQKQGGKLYKAFVASGCVTDGYEEGVVIVSSHTTRSQQATLTPAIALPGTPSSFMVRSSAPRGRRSDDMKNGSACTCSQVSIHSSIERQATTEGFAFHITILRDVLFRKELNVSYAALHLPLLLMQRTEAMQRSLCS